MVNFPQSKAVFCSLHNYTPLYNAAFDEYSIEIYPSDYLLRGEKMCRVSEMVGFKSFQTDCIGEILKTTMQKRDRAQQSPAPSR